MPVPRIQPADLQAALAAPSDASRPVILDARLKYPYAHSTVMIAGAERYTGSAAALPPDRRVVVYDSDPDELVSAAVAAALIRQGYQAAALAGGIAAWLAASGAVVAKDAPKPASTTGSLKP